MRGLPMAALVAVALVATPRLRSGSDVVDPGATEPLRPFLVAKAPI